MMVEPDPTVDAELLRAHGAGDPHAFARLYDRYDPACFQFIRRMLGAAHKDAADDLHQETWIAVSRNATAYDAAKASFAAWLYTIARRKVWDHFRRQKVAVLAAVEEDMFMRAPDEGPSPLDQVQSRELAERVVTAVEALPLEQRGASSCLRSRALTLEEIASLPAWAWKPPRAGCAMRARALAARARG